MGFGAAGPLGAGSGSGSGRRLRLGLRGGRVRDRRRRRGVVGDICALRRKLVRAFSGRSRRGLPNDVGVLLALARASHLHASGRGALRRGGLVRSGYLGGLPRSSVAALARGPRLQHRCSRGCDGEQDRCSLGDPAQPEPRQPAASRRSRAVGAAGAREAELFRPERDSAVAAGRDVEVGMPGRLEVARGRPRVTTCTERFKGGADALVRPLPPLLRLWLDELVARRPAASDPLEQARRHELREVVRRLRPADACDLLVLRAREDLRPVGPHGGQSLFLRRLELDPSYGTLCHRALPRPPVSRTVAHSRIGANRCCIASRFPQTDESPPPENGCCGPRSSHGDGFVPCAPLFVQQNCSCNVRLNRSPVLDLNVGLTNPSRLRQFDLKSRAVIVRLISVPWRRLRQRCRPLQAQAGGSSVPSCCLSSRSSQPQPSR